VSLSDDLYKEIILEHSQNPSHREKLKDPTVVEAGVNRSCGDEIEIELKIEDGKITDVAVTGHGCSISTASSSLMADAIEGMGVHEAEELIRSFKSMILDHSDIEFPEGLEDLSALQGVQKYPVRVKCATLAWNTLEQALKTSLQQK